MDYKIKNNKKIKSCRLSSLTVDAINLISKNENLNESDTTRMLINKGIKEYKLEKAIENYNTKKIDLTKASEIADMTKREFIEELEKRGNKLNIDLETYNYGKKSLKEIFDK